MRRALRLIGLNIAALTAFAATPADADTVTFPAYGEVRNLDDYATEPEYRHAVGDPDFRMERMSYDSDGLKVFAYVYRPVHLPAEKLPVIIFNRGSWTWPAFHAELVTMANRLARRGYLVVAPMYRGSGGAKGRDEMGGGDLADLFNLLPVIRALPEADAGRLYLYGESRGGMMTYQAIRDGFPARAAAVVGAFTDLDSMLEKPEWKQVGLAIWPELDAQRAAIVERRSAQRWADKINVPVLIIHGAEDSLPVSQSLRMAEKLSEQGKHFQLMVIDGEGHTISGRTADRDNWAVDWFQRH
jgi:dipeptidyl aminopeptidase/acylaminoacyl peptidase